MISFACMKIELKNLIKCSFELNKTDYDVFIFLIPEEKNMAANEIANRISLDRTTVQKSIKRLTEKGLVLRTQKNLAKGGYIFVYSVKDKEAIKERMSDIVKKWHDNVQKEISKW